MISYALSGGGVVASGIRGPIGLGAGPGAAAGDVAGPGPGAAPPHGHGGHPDSGPPAGPGAPIGAGAGGACMLLWRSEPTESESCSPVINKSHTGSSDFI